MGARGLGRIWCKGGGRAGRQPHLCGPLGRGADGLSRSVGCRSDGVTGCLRSHLDQTIHFRVKDTKARQGKGWAQGHTAGKGQSQNRKLQFLVPGSRVPTSIPARQFTTEDFVWREKVPFRLRNLFPSQEQFMLKQHGGRTCWKNYEMMQRAREQAAHHLE